MSKPKWGVLKKNLSKLVKTSNQAVQKVREEDSSLTETNDEL